MGTLLNLSVFYSMLFNGVIDEAFLEFMCASGSVCYKTKRTRLLLTVLRSSTNEPSRPILSLAQPLLKTGCRYSPSDEFDESLSCSLVRLPLISI